MGMPGTNYRNWISARMLLYNGFDEPKIMPGAQVGIARENEGKDQL